ncbi:MAG: 1-acyl-sn-glycerol-3-phosphate acyltransferase [Acidimicrobiia bacterium]|nr:1-acyl-sn-glycerol-3-phosphate acyltransferase [Acidimicrobiia bacterium]
MSRLILWFMRRRGWSFVGEVPSGGKAVLVAAPHTSNWDFLVFLAVARYLGIIPRFLGKASLFRGPLGVLMRRWGGIPVDRSKPNEMVATVAREFAAHDEFFLVITPEGTRGSARVWKSGFWRIAKAAGVPIVLGFVDGPNRRTGLGPSYEAEGDPGTWMDHARSFYGPIAGLKPARKGPIVLASEQRDDGG